MISVFLKRRNQVNCIDLIVITTKTSFTVYSAVGAGDAGLQELQEENMLHQKINGYKQKYEQLHPLENFLGSHIPWKIFWANLSEI